MFRVVALPLSPYKPLFSLGDAELARLNARWVVADASPGYPCRVSLQDAEMGERLLLLPYSPGPTGSPYKTVGPIYVREAAEEASPEVGAVPDSLLRRPLSVRAYDRRGEMVRAEVVEGTDLAEHLERVLENPGVALLNVHNARPGCYACRVERA